MLVILLDKMAKLGQLGEVVRVKPGYARNYLLPMGKAKRATKEAIAEFEAQRAEIEKVAAENLSAAQAIASKLENFVVELSEKAAVDGRLFGSVSNHVIAATLAEKGFEVSKSHVRMPNGALKVAGEHIVTLALHPDVVVDLSVNIVGEAA